MEEEQQQNSQKKTEEGKSDEAVYNLYIQFSALLAKEYNTHMDTLRKPTFEHFRSLFS